MSAEVIRLKPVRPCPICGKPSSQAHHPFCSARCQDVDLNRWLSGAYRMPAAQTNEDASTRIDADLGSDDTDER